MNLSNGVVFNKDDVDLFYKDNCDKYDYLISVGVGAIAGLVDIFLVGAPGDSKLGSWTDSQVDNVVKSFARSTGWNPHSGNEDSVASAIDHLEDTFKVNYDHRYGADVAHQLEMTTKNHHLKSLGHSPDILGLFFSILNQFTSTASFIDNGEIIYFPSNIDNHQKDFSKKSFLGKIFFGTVNWFGHIMSDIAGCSKGRREGNGRGSGIAMPFYELFQFCNFGNFDVDGNKQTLATVATMVFEKGYDFRHGITMAIPVLISELLIRFIWAIKRFFFHKIPLKECIPTLKTNPSLRLMLIVSHGTLCVMDGLDAGLRSGGNIVYFFLRLNIIAWFRFTFLVLKEVYIRLALPQTLQGTLNSYKEINNYLSAYLALLEKIDIDKYVEESKSFEKLILVMNTDTDIESFNILLIEKSKELGFSLPWKGDFDSFMKDDDETLVFE